MLSSHNSSFISFLCEKVEVLNDSSLLFSEDYEVSNNYANLLALDYRSDIFIFELLLLVKFFTYGSQFLINLNWNITFYNISSK